MSGPVAEHRAHAPTRLGFALLTFSDSRTLNQDEGGDTLERLVREAGHRVVSRDLVPDELGPIRDAVTRALGTDGVDVVVTTGGTGVSRRDVTPEAIRPLLEKELPGFGELFRHLSFEQVGAAAFASRAFAGVAAGRLLFALPGSPAACRLAMARLVLPEAAHLVGVLRR